MRSLTLKPGISSHGYADVPYADSANLNRVIDLDVDIGADAVDYK